MGLTWLVNTASLVSVGIILAPPSLSRGVGHMRQLVTSAERVKRSEQQYKEKCRQHVAQIKMDIR